MNDAALMNGADDFANGIRKLWNLDKSSVPFLSDQQWVKFRDDPPGFFIRCGDDIRERIWSVIGGRA